jgi:hypothetical protein
MDNNERPLSAEELARMAGMSVTNARYHLQHGHVEGAYKVAAVWLIPYEAAFQWVSEREDDEDD